MMGDDDTQFVFFRHLDKSPPHSLFIANRANYKGKTIMDGVLRQPREVWIDVPLSPVFQRSTSTLGKVISRKGYYRI